VIAENVLELGPEQYCSPIAALQRVPLIRTDANDFIFPIKIRPPERKHFLLPSPGEQERGKKGPQEPDGRSRPPWKRVAILGGGEKPRLMGVLLIGVLAPRYTQQPG